VSDIETIASAPPGELPPEAEIYAWRKQMRTELIARRLKLMPSIRRNYASEIARYILALAGPLDGRVISIYWPMRGEPDLRSLIKPVLDAGGHCALPVVVEKKAPMVFRVWEPGTKLVSGVWNIPVPAGGKTVVPDIVIAPVVGHDPACFRLGYGGGYFDRTLASFTRSPLAIGVGYAQSALPTIYPLPHDVPLDLIVTECGISKSSRAPIGQARSDLAATRG
jgi:5,10-methenyltetrahydrofolate synthetase